MTFKTITPSKLQKMVDPETGRNIISLGSQGKYLIEVTTRLNNLCKDSQHRFRMEAENKLRLIQTADRLRAKLAARGGGQKK